MCLHNNILYVYECIAIVMLDIHLVCIPVWQPQLPIYVFHTAARDFQRQKMYKCFDCT